MIISGTVTEGLFGQPLTWILEVLPAVERIGTGLTCRIVSRNYGEAPNFDGITSFFDHASPHRGEADELYDLFAFKQTNATRFTDFATPHRLWSRYFIAKASIQREVDTFCASRFHGKTLGIHYRGCDKMKGRMSQASPISYQEMDTLIDDYCDAAQRRPDTLFVASDETDYIHHVHVRHGHRFNVVAREDSARNPRDAAIPLFYSQARSAPELTPDPTAFGIDAVCNALLLSRCDVVLKTASALSAWAKIFNPEIEIYRVNAFHHDWFPDAAIPIYAAHSAAGRRLLDTTMNGEARHEQGAGYAN